ncbi:MAG: fumarylacetoacetate hydrolase family protein [Roseiarcus sp.]
MSHFLFDPPLTPSLAIDGLDRRYPVARIFCVGRNYEEHAREMGQRIDRERPFYFCKSATALRESGATIPYPPGTTNYHFEFELVVALGAPFFKGAASEALQAVYGYACGLDMTRRDLQLAERAKQRPWTLGKDVEASAPVSAIAPAARIGHPVSGRIEFKQNGVVRQSSDIGAMVWSVAEILAHLSGFYHLGPGDLIFTGTPAGVGPVLPGDRLEGAIEGVGALSAIVGPSE